MSEIFKDVSKVDLDKVQGVGDKSGRIDPSFLLRCPHAEQDVAVWIWYIQRSEHDEDIQTDS